MTRVHWFFAGLILLALFGMYAPKIAGYVILLIVTYLAIQLANKGLIVDPADRARV